MTLTLQIFQFLLSGLTTGSTYALIAIGFSLIHNSTGIVNFAQGEFVMLGGMFMITFHSFLGLPMLPAFFLTIGAVAAVGLLLERFPLRRARVQGNPHSRHDHRGRLHFYQRAGHGRLGKEPHDPAPSFRGSPLRLSRRRRHAPEPVDFRHHAAVVAALNYFFKGTLIGKAMRAVAASRRSAMLTGIPVDRMILLSFTLSGALGAVAGITLTPITTTSYDVGVMLGLKGFSAAILGGYGSMPGAVLGGLLLGVLESLAAGLISSEYKDAIAFLILLLVLFFKPSGILGKGRLQRV